MAIANPQVTAPNESGTYTGIEAWLTKRGVSYKYEPDFALYTIDKDASLRNQARVGAPLMDEVVERYAIAMSNGAEFPPIVVYPLGKSKFLIIDGNHRLQAALRSETSLNAYVVQNPSQEQITLLTYEANTEHGEPTTIAERERQAMHLIEMGVTHADATKALGVKESRISYLLSDQEATKRLVELGFDANDFGITVRRRLNNVRSDIVLAQAASLVKDGKLTYEQVDSLIPRINAQRTEAQQLSVVTEARRENEGVMRTTAGGSVKNYRSRPLVRLNNIVTRIRDFKPDMLPNEMDPVTKEQLRVALLDATRRMAVILEALN